MAGQLTPSVRAIQKAWRLGRTLAMTDPTFVPQVEDAARFPSYVQFMVEHRRKLQLLPSFWTWDLRLEDMVEDEAERHQLSMDRDGERILQLIDTPIRCAFWFGWEGVTNLKKRYERAAGRKSQPSVETAAQGPTEVGDFDGIDAMEVGEAGDAATDRAELLISPVAFELPAERPVMPG